MAEDDSDLKVEMLKFMLRKEYIGRRYGEETDILSKYHGKQRKRAQKILQSMATNPGAPVGHYKDKHTTYRLIDSGRAKALIERLGGDPDDVGENDGLRILQHG